MAEGVTLDAGALIALDRPRHAAAMQRRIHAVVEGGGTICIPAGVVAQAWRGPRQARLARLLRSRDVEIVPLSLSSVRVIGAIAASSGHADVIDIHVALCARERRHAVITSDAADIAAIDPTLPVITV